MRPWPPDASHRRADYAGARPRASRPRFNSGNPRFSVRIAVNRPCCNSDLLRGTGGTAARGLMRLLFRRARRVHLPEPRRPGMACARPRPRRGRDAAATGLADVRRRRARPAQVSQLDLLGLCRTLRGPLRSAHAQLRRPCRRGRRGFRAGLKRAPRGFWPSAHGPASQVSSCA